jgi:hypothetical protein
VAPLEVPPLEVPVILGVRDEFMLVPTR